jgi:hypothetical protein
LEDIVQTDERVIKDLDRKHRIEYIKEKNEEELQRSAEKLKKPLAYKSPYKSPYH